MGMQLIAYPTIIQKQALAPTLNASSVLWRDTDDDVLYFSDGTSWKQFGSASDAAGWEAAVAQVTLEMLRLSAEGTLTAPDYDNMFLDYFADANGQDNTIDTGNTTASFNTDKYQNQAQAVNSTDHVSEGGDSPTTYQGMGFTTTSASNLSKVTKAPSCTATKCYLYDGAMAGILATGTFSGDVATMDYDLADATDYYILCGKDGANYTRSYDESVSYPYTETDLNFTKGYVTSDTTSGSYNIVSVTTLGTPSALVIRTSAQALNFEPAYILVHVKDITTAGTGAVTFDASFDGGSTWDSTANNLDEKISVTDGSSKNMVIKLNLNGSGAGNTSQIKDYEVILWSS